MGGNGPDDRLFVPVAGTITGAEQGDDNVDAEAELGSAHLPDALAVTEGRQGVSDFGNLGPATLRGGTDLTTRVRGLWTRQPAVFVIAVFAAGFLLGRALRRPG